MLPRGPGLMARRHPLITLNRRTATVAALGGLPGASGDLMRPWVPQVQAGLDEEMTR